MEEEQTPAGGSKDIAGEKTPLSRDTVFRFPPKCFYQAFYGQESPGISEFQNVFSRSGNVLDIYEISQLFWIMEYFF